MQSSRNRFSTIISVTATALLLAGATAVSALTINIDHTTRYQTIRGFGGSIGTSGTDVINAVMVDAGTSVLRVDWCEFTGPNFANSKPFFSAGTVRPIMMGSCWSPPANMKDNNSVSNGGHLLASKYDAFADFAVQKLQAFKAMYGIELLAICPQNEPLFVEFYASCVYSGADLVTVTRILGQKIEAAGLKTKLILADDMYDNWMTLDGPFWTALDKDTIAQKYLMALSFHGYTSNGVTPAVMSATKLGLMYKYAQTKKCELWQTENGGSMGLKYASDVIACVRYGKVSMYLKYGLSGDEPGMVGDVNEYYYCKGAPTKTLYAAKQISKFVRPGSVQFRSSSSDSATFSNFFCCYDPAAKALVLVLATTTTAQTIQLQGTGLPATFQKWVTDANTNCVNQGDVANSATISIPANTIVTLYGSNYTPPVVGVLPDAMVGRVQGGAHDQSSMTFELTGRKIRVAGAKSGAVRVGVVVAKGKTRIRIAQ